MASKSKRRRRDGSDTLDEDIKLKGSHKRHSRRNFKLPRELPDIATHRPPPAKFRDIPGEPPESASLSTRQPLAPVSEGTNINSLQERRHALEQIIPPPAVPAPEIIPLPVALPLTNAAEIQPSPALSSKKRKVDPMYYRPKRHS